MKVQIAKIAGLVLLLISLVFCSFLFLRHAPEHYDIDEHDESVYLSGGTQHFKTPGDWAPLYSSFYSIYFLQTSDPLVVYFRNLQWLSGLLPVTFFILMIAVGIEPLIAAPLSLFFLISGANLPLIPKSHHFAALVSCLGLIGVYSLKSSLARSWALSLLCLFLCFIRPEYIVSLPLSLLFTLVLTFKRKIKNSRNSKKNLNWKVLASLFVFFTVCFLIQFGPPWGDRGSLAFRQNFCWAYRIREFNQPYSSLPDHELFERIFGKNTGPLSSLFYNPKEWFRHIEYNLGQLVSQLYSFSIKDLIEVAYFSVVIAGFLFLWRRKLKWPSSKSLAPHFKKYMFPVLFLLFPLICTCILYFCRDRYLVLGVIGGIFFIGLCMPQIQLKPSSRLLASFVLACILPGIIRSFNSNLVFQARPNLEKIQYVRGLRYHHPGKCLSYPFFLSIYFYPICSEIVHVQTPADLPKNLSLEKYVLQDGVDFIFITPEMLTVWQDFQAQKDLHEFLSHTDQIGYEIRQSQVGGTIVVAKKGFIL